MLIIGFQFLGIILAPYIFSVLILSLGSPTLSQPVAQGSSRILGKYTAYAYKPSSASYVSA